jgi:transposase, IS5 family
MKMKQHGFFDEIDRLVELTKLGDPLITLGKKIPWESFREILQVIRPVTNPNNEKNAGRKPFDEVMMFKIMILQRFYSLSDDQMEFQLKDRRSFERFVSDGDTLYHMPDAKTIWLYREKFNECGITKKIFKLFEKQMEASGLIGKSGKIIDASFVEVPRQRNSREENQKIKEGEVPEDWAENKKEQKDTDARWTTKNKEKHFGYKNHVTSDKESGLILDYATTSAEVHDSQVIEDVLGEPRNENEPVWADSAYRSAEIEEKLTKMKYKSKVHEKGYRGKPLTDEQKELNREKSKVRVCIEHIFGMMYWMGGDYLRYIGRKRVSEAIGMINLVFNMRRFCYLTK